MKKTALVTGATSGIGLELARLFASRGHGLVISGRNEKKLAELASELAADPGVPVEDIPADLSAPDGAARLYEEITRRGLEVEYLVNNAGTQVYGKFAENDADAERAMLELKLVSVVELSRYFLREMKARGSGRILNIGSTGSFAPGPFNALYCASKAFVLSFSEAVNEELSGTGVSVTVLCPGATRTNFASNAGIEQVRLFRLSQMSAERVARIGYRAMMRGKRVAVAGWLNRLQVASIRFAPRRLVVKVSRALMT
jgi:short-subunit dehydrogenase